MRAGEIDLLDLALPLTLRPSERVSDDELMRFSERNKPYKIERNKNGDLTIMTPVGGLGGTHERYITRVFGNWTPQDGTGIDFSPNTGFNLPDGSCLAPDAAWIRLERWNSLTIEEQEGFPPLCPDFIVEVRSKRDSQRLLEAKMQSWLDNGAQLACRSDREKHIHLSAGAAHRNTGPACSRYRGGSRRGLRTRVRPSVACALTICGLNPPTEKTAISLRIKEKQCRTK